MLWNLSSKEDSLWVCWVHTYYVKNEDVMPMDIKENGSWILRSIFQLRNMVGQMDRWKELNANRRIRMKKNYMAFLEEHPKVDWRGMIIKNNARPRAVFTLWLACHKIYT